MGITIAFVGLKRSGKDSAANYLRDQYGFEKKFFADPIKRALNVIFDWDPNIWEGPQKEQVDARWGISPRQAAQHLGTEWAQHALTKDYPQFAGRTGRLLWVRRMFEGVSPDKNIVISDLRFPHEAEYIQSIPDRQTYLIRINRHHVAQDDNHASEFYAQTIPVNFTIDNDLDLRHMYRSLDEIMNVLSIVPVVQHGWSSSP